MALKVFLVEDSPTLQKLILALLADMPNVTCAGSADTESAAIDDLGRLACDVVILDIKLKSGTGLGVLRALSAPDWPNRPSTRVVLSNYADDAFREIARSLGATQFFDKARDCPLLMELISELAAARQ